jgi:hypothetical protein
MNKSKKVKKRTLINSGKDESAQKERFTNFFYRTLLALSCWNVGTLVFSLIVLINKSSPVTFPNSYGDYLRGDLFYLLVQGNFGNPYSFHPEIPNLRNQPYLPFPYLVIDLLGIELNEFDHNLLWVHLVVISFLLPILLFFYFLNHVFPLKVKILSLIGLAITSPPFLYLFTTGNIQSLIVSIGLLGVILAGNEVKFKRFLFFATAITFSTKPQFALIFLQFVINKISRIKTYIIGVLFGAAISVFGLFVYPNTFVNNFDYWFQSIKGFVKNDPVFVVHNNSSIVGNLSAIELYFMPSKLNELISIRYSTLVVLLALTVLLYFIYRMLRIQGTAWIQSWLLLSILTLVTPVSYNYNLALFLIPIGILFYNESERTFFYKVVLSQTTAKICFLAMIFLIFASKPHRVWLIKDIADTNLFNLVNALSVIFALIVSSRYISNGKQAIK